jgi:hypothetical protein
MKPWSLSGSPPIVFDPPAWCGVAWRPPSLVEKLLSGGDESSGALGRDLVTGKRYSCVSASTTWTKGGLVPTDTTG